MQDVSPSFCNGDDGSTKHSLTAWHKRNLLRGFVLCQKGILHEDYVFFPGM